MGVVWKYRLSYGEQTIRTPPVLGVVHAGLDGAMVHSVWLHVGEGPAQEFVCRVVATGEHFDTSWRHCKTFMDGSLVWHLLVPQQSERKP